jgi:signal-transduction protein with cAMP-binding, CBS, and nucleotidyltransferase domain
VKIRDILAKKDKKIISVDGHVSVSQAVADMVAANVGSVLVVVDGVVDGIFTERDAMKLWKDHEKVKDEAIVKFMTTNLIIASPEDTIESAMSMMSQKNIRHLVVVEAKKLLNVLSMKDLVKAYAGTIAAHIQYMQKIAV